MMCFGGVCVCVCACFLLTVLGCRVCELCDDACWIMCVIVFVFFFCSVCLCGLLVTCRAMLYGLLLCVLLCCVLVCHVSNVRASAVCHVLCEVVCFCWVVLVWSFNVLVWSVVELLRDVLWLAFVLCLCG